MSDKYVWMNATISVPLSKDTPLPPEDWDEYDAWYMKWIEPALLPIYEIPNIDIDTHEQEYEL